MHPGEEIAQRARTLDAAADVAAREASEAVAMAVEDLRRAGHSLRDIGTMTGVSYQRAHQLLSR